MGICSKAGRVTILHRNIPNSLSRFTGAMAKENINISDLMNRSRGEYAYTMLDLDAPAPDSVIEELQKIDGVLRVRVVR
jgi:D-3-phosphoglycerate dehydrogenase